MMQTYPLGAPAAAPTPLSPNSRPPEASCCFDLQIIQGSPQVKMPGSRGLSAVLRISLGFKQLAHGLHVAPAVGSNRLYGVACGDSRHRNKLMSRRLGFGVAGE
jgi:hypothetical protein